MEPQPTKCSCGDFTSSEHFDTLKVTRSSQSLAFVVEFHFTDGRTCETFRNGELDRIEAEQLTEEFADLTARVLAGLQASV